MGKKENELLINHAAQDGDVLKVRYLNEVENIPCTNKTMEWALAFKQWKVAEYLFTTGKVAHWSWEFSFHLYRNNMYI